MITKFTVSNNISSNPLSCDWLIGLYMKERVPECETSEVLIDALIWFALGSVNQKSPLFR